MAEAKKLNSFTTASVMKETDYLLATDSSGSGRKITRASLLHQDCYAENTMTANEYHWVTVATMTKASATGGLLQVTTGLWAGNPGYHLFAIGNRYASSKQARPAVSSLLGTITSAKLRIVVLDDLLRIDVYEYFRKIVAHVDGEITIGDMALDADVPADATVYEYDFSQSASGG